MMSIHKVGDLVFYSCLEKGGKGKYIGMIVKIISFNGIDKLYDVDWYNDNRRRYTADTISHFKINLRKELEQCTR